MKKSLRLIPSLFPIIVSFVSIYFISDYQKIFYFIICSILIFVFLNFDDIKEISFGKDGLSLKKEIKKAQSLNKDLEQTISSIKEWTMPLIRFSTALLKKDGSFDNITDYKEIILFIDSTLKLMDKYETMDDLIFENIEVGIVNMVNAFDYEIKNKYGISPIQKGIIKVTGDLVGETPILESINLNDLKNLIPSNTFYQDEVSLFAHFIRNYASNKIK